MRSHLPERQFDKSLALKTGRLDGRMGRAAGTCSVSIRGRLGLADSPRYRLSGLQVAQIVGRLNGIGCSFTTDMLIFWPLERLTFSLERAPAASGFQFERVWLIIDIPMIRREALNESF